MFAAQVPDVNQYHALVTSQEFPESFSIMNPRLMTSPLYMRLREHHCINPMQPVGAALPQFEGDTDEGICNGWFPKMSLTEHGGRVRVEDERRRQVSAPCVCVCGALMCVRGAGACIRDVRGGAAE